MMQENLNPPKRHNAQNIMGTQFEKVEVPSIYTTSSVEEDELLNSRHLLVIQCHILRSIFCCTCLGFVPPFIELIIAKLCQSFSHSNQNA